MANTIKVRRSAVQNAVPTTGQLALGELAINTYDGKLFLKKDDGTASVVEIGAGGAAGVQYFYQDTPPSSPQHGYEWTNRSDPKLPTYRYINDGTSSQWVNLNATWVYSGPVSYELSVDFGTQPVDSTQFQITSIPVAVGQHLTAAPSGVDGDELECDMLSCAAFVSATDTINLYVHSFPGPVTGVRNLVLFVS